MFWSFFFGIAVAVLAVFGFTCAVQMIVEACFPMKQIVTMVQIQTPQDVEMLEMLLREAQMSFFQRRSARQGVLLSEALCENGQISEDVLRILKKYNADCYIIEPNE